MAAITTTLMAVGALAGAGASVYQAKEAKKAQKEAKREAVKQQALVAKQEAKIEAEKRKQAKEQQDRRARAMTKDLLTGSETGITDQPTGTLLAPAGGQQ